MKSSSNSFDKRLIISVHNSLPTDFLGKIKQLIHPIKSSHLEYSEYVPENTITVLYNEIAIKPMIYFNQTNMDEQFLDNIDEQSIVLTNEFNDINLKCYSSYHHISLLPFTIDSCYDSLNFVLTSNNIIGHGFSTIVYGEKWEEILCKVPNISRKTASLICTLAKNRQQFLNVFGDPFTKDYEPPIKIPIRIIKSLYTFLTSENPKELLDFTQTKKKKSNEK